MTEQTGEEKEFSTPSPGEEAPAEHETEGLNFSSENDPEETSEEARNGNAEAAKWRTRLRETEAERDTLAGRLQRLQRAEVTRLAQGPGLLHDGTDLATDLADLTDDDGDIDPQRVTEAVAALREAKPHLGAPAYGEVGQGERQPASGGTTWADIIKG